MAVADERTKNNNQPNDGSNGFIAEIQGRMSSSSSSTITSWEEARQMQELVENISIYYATRGFKADGAANPLFQMRLGLASFVE